MFDFSESAGREGDPDEVDAEFLAAYVEGLLSPEQEADVEARMAVNPELRKKCDELTRIFHDVIEASISDPDAPHASDDEETFVEDPAGSAITKALRQNKPR